MLTVVSRSIGLGSLLSVTDLDDSDYEPSTSDDTDDDEGDWTDDDEHEVLELFENMSLI